MLIFSHFLYCAHFSDWNVKSMCDSIKYIICQFHCLLFLGDRSLVSYSPESRSAILLPFWYLHLPSFGAIHSSSIFFFPLEAVYSTCLNLLLHLGGTDSSLDSKKWYWGTTVLGYCLSEKSLFYLHFWYIIWLIIQIFFLYHFPSEILKLFVDLCVCKWC